MSTVWFDGGCDTPRKEQVADSELARLQRRYRALQHQVHGLGFIASGSLVERYTVCGTERCRCHGNPPARHGPYLQYTRKVAGKTLTQRLTPQQAEHYAEWIANRRRLDELIAEMNKISGQARELLLAPLPPAKHQRAVRN
jgi:hypothetical protein